MKLKDISYKILEALRHELTADEHIDIREIEHDIVNMRATLIRNEYDKRKNLGLLTSQSLGCLDVIPVDASTCCVDVGVCQILRTKDKLPSFLKGRQREFIERVGPTNIAGESFSIIEQDRASSVGNGRFNKHTIYTFSADNYLYFVSNDTNAAFKALSVVNVRGVFEDPRELAKLLKCDGQPCYDEDTEFPIGNHLLVDLEGMITKQYLEIERMTSEDKALDGDNTVGQGGAPRK